MNLLFTGDLCAIENKHKFKQFVESSDIIFYVSDPFLRYSFWKITLLSPHMLFKMLEATDKTTQWILPAASYRLGVPPIF